MPSTGENQDSSRLSCHRSNLVMALLGVAFVALLLFGVFSQAGYSEEVVAADVGGTQYVSLEARPEVYPARVQVKADQPIQVAVQASHPGETLVFPDLRVSRRLGENVTVIDLAPLPPGQYRFVSKRGYINGMFVAR